MTNKENSGKNVNTPFEFSFSSEILLQQAIAGLLMKMPDITGVQILQGTQEYGKDIIFYMRGGFAEQMLCACVVKNTKITGNVDNTRGARTIFHQAEQAFDTCHIDESGRDIPVERVYIVSPFDLPPSTISSIKGKLQSRGGQVRFISGSMLFDLFKQYWPDYLADEAEVIEQHLRQIQDDHVIDTNLTALAFQYNLGEVSSEARKVYVAQSFYREVLSYAVNQSLVKIPDIKDQTRKTEVDEVVLFLNRVDSVLSQLNEWGLCDSYEEITFQAELTQLLEKFNLEWDNLLRAKKAQLPAILIKLQQLLAPLSKLTEKRKKIVDDIEAELENLRRAIALTKLSGCELLSSQSFLNSCYLDDCIHTIPEGMFQVTNKKRVEFSKNLLDEWASHLLIVGAPGYGKTSFCRWQALQDAEKYNSGLSTILPIYIPLHKLARGRLGSFEQTFLGRLGKSALLSETSQNLKTKVRIYLDGLDEVASVERRREIIDLAREGSKDTSSYQIIVTARDYVYGKWLGWLPRVALNGFDDPDIREFVDKWIGLKTKIGEDFLEQLYKTTSLLSLMRIPLLATLIVLVFKQTGKLPENKTKLYESFVDLLSGGWDVTKGVLRESKFGQRIKISVLSNLAFTTHMRKYRVFTDDDIQAAIRPIFSVSSLSDWQLLRDEFITDGLVNKAGSVLQFAHFSFQEFLAAKYLIGCPQPVRASRALESYLYGDDWWREMLKFYIGLSTNSKEAVTWLLHEIQRVKTSKSIAAPISRSHAEEMFVAASEIFPEYSLKKHFEDPAIVNSYPLATQYLKAG